MTTLSELNKNHEQPCACFYCVQSRKRYTDEEWRNGLYRSEDKMCVHCKLRATKHAAFWTDLVEGQEVEASGACPIMGLLKDNIKSVPFERYDKRFSSEYTFDEEEEK